MSAAAETAIARAAAVLGDRAQRNVALAPFTTYRVGGPASLFFEVRTESDLALAQRAVSTSGVSVLVVGRGSNLLVADAGFAGLALTLRDAFGEISVEGSEVEAGAAVALPVLARKTAACALRGLEWAVGVPGSVGGAVRMNAGGHGSDISKTLVSARVLDLADADAAPRAVNASALDLSYRHSNLGRCEIVIAATFRLGPGERAASEAKIAEIVSWRRAHQPGGSNAGSVFTNPPDDSAGRLIEVSGLKGLRVGTAAVSERHANFIQVEPGGAASDVAKLMERVSKRVLEHSGVELKPEVHMVGFHESQPEGER